MSAAMAMSSALHRLAKTDCAPANRKDLTGLAMPSAPWSRPKPVSHAPVSWLVFSCHTSSSQRGRPSASLRTSLTHSTHRLRCPRPCSGSSTGQAGSGSAPPKGSLTKSLFSLNIRPLGKKQGGSEAAPRPSRYAPSTRLGTSRARLRSG